jgi:hypothetical protein
MPYPWPGPMGAVAFSQPCKPPPPPVGRPDDALIIALCHCCQSLKRPPPPDCLQAPTPLNDQMQQLLVLQG